jgi:CRP-like cAMP-binding protein
LESLFKHIGSITSLSPEAMKALQSILHVKTYAAGTILCKMDELPTQVYFIKSGFARGYAWSSKGTSYNRAIYTSNEFMASLSALIQKKKLPWHWNV